MFLILLFASFNDGSDIPLKQIPYKMVFAGFTSAEKTIINRWFSPDVCMKSFWVCNLVNIVNLELLHDSTRLGQQL